MATFRKKIDNRIRVQIENGVALQHRSMFVVVGDRGKDQVVILHHMLSKAAVKARPSVLWCYKKELGFSSNRKKRMRQLQKKIKNGTLNLKQDDPFELFVAATNIRYCYYKETHKILGNTFGMCVLQDFEALTPNLLARTVETVEGGGMVVILLRTMNSLKQLYTMAMMCVVIDDQLNILPVSTHMSTIKAIPPKTQEDGLSPRDQELKDLKDSLKDTQPVGCVGRHLQDHGPALGLAVAGAIAFGYSNIFITSPSPDNLHTLFEFIFKGFDALQYQARHLAPTPFIRLPEHLDYEIIQSLNPEFNKAVVRVNIFKEHRQTIQLLVIDEAAAIPLPLVKNLLGPYLVFMASTINGYEGTGRSLSLKLIQQLRQQSAESQQSMSAENKITNTPAPSTRSSLHESIRYGPGDAVEKWLNELLCLDCLNIPRLISGCPLPQTCDLYYVNRDTLFCYHKASEVFLQRLMALYVSSHYKNSPNDLQLLSDAPAHHLFCLLPPVPPTQNSLPEVLAVVQVSLEGEISRQSILNSLSRGKKAAGDLIPWTVSEQFQDPEFGSLSGARIVRIAVNPDYQGMGYGTRALELLQMYYEGKFPTMDENGQTDDSEITPVNSEVISEPEVGRFYSRTSGGETAQRLALKPGSARGEVTRFYLFMLISWIVSNRDHFGIRVRTVSLLEEVVTPRKELPPLLLKLSERRAERLHYLGVSYGLTTQLLRFWKRAGYTPVYLRQTPNDLTGEHSCVMLKDLRTEEVSEQSQWLSAFWTDFRRRFISLLSYQFSSFQPSMALNILQNRNSKETANNNCCPPPLTSLNFTSFTLFASRVHLSASSSPNSTQQPRSCALHFSPYDLKRMELYSRSMVDYHLIMDLVPNVARLFFQRQLGNISLSAAQCALLLGVGLQHKSVDQLEKEIELPSTQLMGLFNRLVRKIVQVFSNVQEQAIEAEMVVSKDIAMEPTIRSLTDDLDEAAQEFDEKHKKDLEKIKELNFEEYEIRGNKEEWDHILKKAGSTAVVRNPVVSPEEPPHGKFKKENQRGKFKKSGGKKGKFGKKP
ncbi:hypothetical protein CRUP_023413 [Coryphaenoides rupestris]|nr:hypothetical protein CRUP_023413 [Coryphaenoides rupestris]